MKSKKIRTRFAPSPTGYLHVGSLRTALYNFLFAKKNNGEFLLRIEDTDRARFVPDADKQIVKILKEFGLNPNNLPPHFSGGANVSRENREMKYPERWGGKKIIYQSERLEIYKKYAEQLVGEGKAYYCFCAEETLAKIRDKQNSAKQPPGYWGSYRKCNQLSREESEKKIKNGEKYVIRFKMLSDDNEPKEALARWTDLIHGEIPTEMNFQEDFIIQKSDGFPTYNFANVVDDHLMEISHVIRGDEFLPSTIKHIKLYQAFGWPPPQFVHLPLLLNPDKSKLSKRQGDVAVEDYLQKGYLPAAIINFIALLGWNPKTEQEIFNFDELVKQFSLEKVNKSGAVFNIEKLNWLNGCYIRKMDLNELTKKCIPYLENANLIEGAGDDKWKITATGEPIIFDWLKQIVALEQERLVKLSDLPELVKFFFVKKLDCAPEMLIWKRMKPDEAAEHLMKVEKLLKNIEPRNFNKINLEKEIKKLIEEKKMGMGETLWPFRVALTGLRASPPPFDVAEVLGKEKTVERIKNAIISLK